MATDSKSQYSLIDSRPFLKASVKAEVYSIVNKIEHTLQ